ncbi:MAG: SDR family NAD(P)-dependent oxidoreductase [Chloroflexia bacterium]
MILQNKNAIIYGGGGGIGGGVARTFAREGARVFLVGRTLDKLQAVAADIEAAGGLADVAVVDVLDEQAINEHARAVAAKAGSVDVSMNLITHGDDHAGGYVQGVPLVDIPVEDFFRPITKAVKANYITAQAAARLMTNQKSGVILTLTNAGSQGGMPLMGSTGVAASAIELFALYLASEVGEYGVRVCGLRIAAVPELWSPEIRTHVFDWPPKEQDNTTGAGAGQGGMDAVGLVRLLADRTMLRRPTTLAQVADTAAFLASDLAGGITATFANVTGGMVQD